MQSILHLIGRQHALFSDDLKTHEAALAEAVRGARFLVIGGAGSIGQAVTKELFKRKPRKLHVVDLSENNMVELVRDIRSTFGYIDGDFRTFILDVGSLEYDAFWKADGTYDYVLNLSALKHVRSEKDPYTLMRMIEVNVFNTLKTLQQSHANHVKKYFCVSTDKAANPANLMGASKRIMELYLMQQSEHQCLSTARFANVAFSDGSLLQGFEKRLQKRQPLVAPIDVKRYFVTPQESGELCLMSTIFGENRDIFFPKLSESLHLITFSDIAVRFLNANGYEPYLCQTEDEARQLIHHLPQKGQWPCLFTPSDTTGEKDIEEFYTGNEVLDLNRFINLGIIKNDPVYDAGMLDHFSTSIQQLRQAGRWTKEQLVALIFDLLPTLDYVEKGKYLDAKM